MTLFDPKNRNEKTAKLIQSASADFKFEKSGIRTRLMSNIEEQQMSLAERKIREHVRKTNVFRRRATAASLVVLLLVVGTGATFAEADISKPGDKLHTIDELQEQLLLKLPLPSSSKARIRASIVEERNQELEYLITHTNNPVRAQAVRSSQQSLNNAIENVRRMQENFTTQGKDSQAEKMDEVLKRLEALAEQQEKHVQALKSSEADQEVIKQFEIDLQAIGTAKTNAKRK